MGVKRPFKEEEESLESSFKQAKQLDSGNQLTSFGEAFSSSEVSQTNDHRGKVEDDFDRSQLFKGLENVEKVAASNLADKELDTSAPLSWVTSSSSEEDAGSGEPFYLSLFPEYFEISFPRRTAVPLEDAYSSLLNSSPRRQVPIGPIHQADIPVWHPTAIQRGPGSLNNLVEDNSEQNLVGTCIVSLSDSKSPLYSNVKVGQGRRDCDCLDRGSVRCVRQHVKEARERFRDIIGEEKFADLGCYDMGEEVALKWTEEEERVLHEVIYSNPLSLRKNFWKQLSVVFPSRTKKELVSYYFNVFMLRRRAVQNRSNVLEIDSDDDEWQGDDRVLFGVEGEDEDSGVESLLDHDAQFGSEDDIPYGNDDDESSDKDDDYDDDDSDDGKGDGDFGGNCDIGAGGEDAIKKHDIGCQMSRPLTETLLAYVNSDCIGQNKVNPKNIMEDPDARDYLSTSKTQPCMIGTSGSVDVGADSRESTLNGDFSRYLAGESNGSNDVSETSFLLEPCEDTNLWDDSCSTGLVKGVDLLSTCSMIEEIFGPCTPKGN